MTDNLSLPQVSPSQNQKETTINAATAQLSGALADTFDVDFTSGDVTLSSGNFTQYMGFIAQNNSVARNFTIPDVKRALFMVQNTGSATLTIKVGTTSLTLAAGQTGFYQTDGTTNGLVTVAPTPPLTGQELDIALAMSGKPSASQTVNIPVNVAITLPASLTGSNFFIGTNPAATMAFTLKHGVSGSFTSIGSVSFNTSGVASVTFSGSVNLAVGDVLQIIAPSSQDSTGADVGLNFKASKQ